MVISSAIFFAIFGIMGTVVYWGNEEIFAKRDRASISPNRLMIVVGSILN